MNEQWMQALSPQGAAVENFGDAAGEVAAAAQGTVVCALRERGLIRASGEDAGNFLHNLLTNDINGLAADRVQRAGLCTPKGRLLADFLVWHEGDAWMLQVSADILPAILKKLTMYVLRAKVKLADMSGERVAIGLSGPDAANLVAALGGAMPSPMGSAPLPDGGSVIGLDVQRCQMVVDAAQAPEVFQRLAQRARPVGAAAWRWLEIARGIPGVTAPVQEQFVPQMVNFELIGGVGFKKGCYPGQEIVARTQYLGKIKKRMFRLHLAQGSTSAGENLFAPETGDQVCGTVVSSAPSPRGGMELLGVLPASVAAAGIVHLGSPAGPPLSLLELPYQID